MTITETYKAANKPILTTEEFNILLKRGHPFPIQTPAPVSLIKGMIINVIEEASNEKYREYVAIVKKESYSIELGEDTFTLKIIEFWGYEILDILKELK